MLTGIGIGSALVRWALRNPKITLARTAPPTSADAIDLDRGATVPGDTDPGEDSGSHPSAVAFAAICLALVVSVALLWGLRWLAGLVGLTIFDKLPLFPVAVIGGFLVQWAATAFGLDRYLDRRAVNGISSIALDVLVICAIGTMSLATIGSNIPAVVTFTVLGVGWSLVTVVWLGPRFHGRNWFEHAIADFGQSQGNVATGFVLADMTDPRRDTDAARDYGYKQLLYEPFLGGGLLTALSVPLITALGLPTFTIASLLATAVVGWIGVRRRHAHGG
jgi:ESS family glutamate:Na+ symporter